MIWILLSSITAPPPPPPTPIWEETSTPALIKLHRYIGYTIVAGGVLQSTLGWYLLSQYDQGYVPSNTLRITHRGLGYTLIGLATTNALLGSWNLWRISQKNPPGTKRVLHAFLGWTTTAAYVYAGVLAYQARTLPAFSRYRAHRNAALTGVGATAIAVLTIVW